MVQRVVAVRSAFSWLPSPAADGDEEPSPFQSTPPARAATRGALHEPSSSHAGEKKKDKAARVATGSLWVPAINNQSGFGRWAFIEVDDPWNAANTIRAILTKGTRP